MWTLFAGQLVYVPGATRAGFFGVDFDEEGCEAVDVSDVIGCSVASLELMQSSAMCEDFEFFRVGSCESDVTFVSVVSSLVGIL